MGEDMFNLLAKHFSGQATEEEMAEVKKWIAANPSNEADYRLLEKLWHVSAEQEPIQFNTEKALQQVSTQIDAAEGIRKRAPVLTLQRAVAIAAMLVIALAIWWFAAHYNSMKVTQALAAIEEVELQDGTKVYLRKGAVLQYPTRFEGNKRRVHITGEAFFEVAHDKTKPFTIAANETEVTVVGTSFSVIAEKDSVAVIVKTGKVSFGLPDHNKVMLAAGERGLYSHDHLTKSINTNENFNAWQSKQLAFRNTPLYQTIATLRDYYGASIMLNKNDSARIAGTGITVTFNDQSLSSVLNELSVITSYRIQKVQNKHYEISLQ